jgi:protein-S-isoprenylcysteine O-methyltransferase Ste14
VGVVAVRQSDNGDRKSTILSWLAVLVLGLAISGLFGMVIALFAEDWSEFSDWFLRWVSWNSSLSGWPPVLTAVLVLTLAILVATVLARAFKRGPQRVEGKALIVGSWVLSLPAFISGFLAVIGLSYMMHLPFIGGGLMSTVTMLLIRRGVLPEDMGEWIARGAVGAPNGLERPAEEAWRVVALLLVAFGLAITIVGFIQVLRAYREKRLETHGLYATVRHPQHLAIGLWSLGLALAANVTAAYMTWFTVLYFYVVLALWEESHLAQHFGSAYEDYRQKTPFIIPFVRSGLPLPRPGAWRVVALVAYYVAGMAVLCLIMQGIGVTTRHFI